MTTTTTLDSSHDNNALTHQFLSLSLEEPAIADRDGCGNDSNKSSNINNNNKNGYDGYDGAKNGNNNDPNIRHQFNRLELEHTYLSEQNAHLTKELSFSRYTIHALRNITTQKDTALQETRQELDRAYFRIRMLGMTLLRQEQQLLQQQQEIQIYQEERNLWDAEKRRLRKKYNHVKTNAGIEIGSDNEDQEDYYQQHEQQPTPPESPRAILNRHHNDDINTNKKCSPSSVDHHQEEKQEKQEYHHQHQQYYSQSIIITPPSPSNSSTITTGQ